MTARPVAAPLKRILFLLASLGICLGARAENVEEFAAKFMEIGRSDRPENVCVCLLPSELHRYREAVQVPFTIALSRSPALKEKFGRLSDGLPLNALTDIEFYRAFHGIRHGSTEQEVIRNSSFKILGLVKEGDETHVLVRVTFQGYPTESDQISVLTVVRVRGEWKMKLTGEMKRFVESSRMAGRSD